MSQLTRTSSIAFQCTKRMLHDFIGSSLNVKKTRKSVNKVLKSDWIMNNDIIINNKLKNNEEIVGNQWAKIRTELLETFEKKITESTVDSLVFDLCKGHNKVEEGKNYFKFLESNNYNISLGIFGRYLRCIIENEELTEADEQEIYRICDHIKEKYPLLDSRTCTDCIVALARTKRWNEAYQMLDMLLFSDTPGVGVICALCKAAFKHDKPEIAWKLMNNYIKKYPMEHKVYLEYLEYCKRHFKGQNLVEEIEKIFYFWRKNDVTVVDFVMKQYMNTFTMLGYKASFADIYNQQTCSKCNTSLQRTTLSASDFKILSEAVLKNLIIGKNVYLSTSPEELKRYMLFIKTLKPYDVIIDGLNVSYTAVLQDRRASLDNVLEVVNMFIKKNKRVLVIGRAHMRWWSKETMKKIEQRADVFLIKNISQDDPFLLHLTLISGPQTYFVSRDLMRQHSHSLEKDHLIKLFRHWQLSRQYMCIKDKKKNKIELIPPALVESNAQKVDNRWHIPCTRNPTLPLPVNYTLPNLWACLMKKESIEEK